MKKITPFILAFILQAISVYADEITIIAVGDIMPTERATPFLKDHGFGYPYGKTKDILSGGDIVIGNLETPLALKGERYADKKYTFKAPLETAPALKEAGFTHLSLANNHVMDYGGSALLSTLAALDSAGLKYSGAGENIFKAREASISETRDKKVAFLSYSKTYPTEFYAGRNRPGTAPGYAKSVGKDITEASASADMVIVAFHWGGEKLEVPREYQRELAHLAIDSGARIVIGHHPHVLQGVEYYRDGVIFYSLGNFAFGSYSPSSKESIIAKIVIDEGSISRVEAIPINVNNFEVHFRPEVLEGKRGEAVISRLSSLSESLGSRLVFAEGKGTLEKLEKLASRQKTP